MLTAPLEQQRDLSVGVEAVEDLGSNSLRLRYVRLPESGEHRMGLRRSGR